VDIATNECTSVTTKSNAGHSNVTVFASRLFMFGADYKTGSY
jgi:hypothetical protein